MSKISWNKAGERQFEVGVRSGVLYVAGKPGVPWNGLISVRENSTGVSTTPYYIDGVKFQTTASMKEFAGEIEAYTYPDEFAACDGTLYLYDGFMVDEQPSDSFGFSYRTQLGNDLRGIDDAYKLHIVYNALATPTNKDYGTIQENPEPLTFSWSFVTTPLATSRAGLSRYSHLSIESTGHRKAFMRAIEAYLYGTAKTDPVLPTLEQLEAIYLNPPPDTLKISYRPTVGLSPMVEEEFGDLIGFLEKGLYTKTEESRLEESVYFPGFYTFGPMPLWPRQLTEEITPGVYQLVSKDPRDLETSFLDPYPLGVYSRADGSKLRPIFNEGVATIGPAVTYILSVAYNDTTGLSVVTVAEHGDLIDGPVNDGLYARSDESNLTETPIVGFYIVPRPILTHAVDYNFEKGISKISVADQGDLVNRPTDDGIYSLSDDTKLVESTTPGLYIVSEPAE